MGREQRRIKAEADLGRLEEAYIVVLADALRACKAGTVGMFGSDDTFYVRAGYEKSKSLVRRQILEAGAEIDEKRAPLGLGRYPWHEGFVAFSKRAHGDHALAEQKLAAELLAELKESGLLEPPAPASS